MTINVDKFTTHLRRNAASVSQARCARYVRVALEAGGARTAGHPLAAREWGPTLLSILILLVAVLAAWPGVAPAGERASATAVVARLYKDFAWQAIAASDGQSAGAENVFGRNLARQSDTELRKYFAPSLANLLLRDARCVTAVHGPCNLDFDPVFASQDPAAVDLLIRAMDDGGVKVAYKHPSSGESVTLEFRGRVVGGSWRISDIVYKNMDGISLRELLMRKVPD